VIPPSAPGVAACGGVMFIISWHELLIPLILISKMEFMTQPVVIAVWSAMSTSSSTS